MDGSDLKAVGLSIFDDESDEFTGPPLDDDMVKSAEESLGVTLPQSYLDLLSERNGGTLRRRCFPTDFPTSWAEDHFQVVGIVGIGGEHGIVNDDDTGSAYMIKEWDYPDIGVVIGSMPSAGHDALMLDYSDSGPDGEPAVAYVDEDRKPRRVADSFAAFLSGLEECRDENDEGEGPASPQTKLGVGDVFTIPIDDRVGFGQIVDVWGESGVHYYIAIFEELHSRDELPDVETVVKGELAFLALSMDALLQHEQWKVVGRCEVDSESLPWPAYKEIDDTDRYEIVDHAGQRRREVTPEEAERFPDQIVVAPILLEQALKARHGIGEAHEDEELRPPPKELSEAAVFGD